MNGPGAWLILDEGTNVDESTLRIELRRRSGPSMWTVVDVQDAAKAGQHRWRALVRPHTSYAVTEVRAGDGNRATLYLHRFLVDAPDGLEVDHTDHNGLNNRRSNLRLATESQNQGNSRPQVGRSSKFRGVSWDKHERAWRSQIVVAGRQVTLGRYAIQEEAAHAYDAAARDAWGDFALLNLPRKAA